MKQVGCSLVVCACIVYFVIIAARSESAGAGRSEQSATKPAPVEVSYKEWETKLCEQLYVSALWTDPKQRENLLGLIHAVGVLRTPAALPILLKHLNYDASPDDLGGQKPVAMKWPAMGAIVKIGIPAVTALLELAKSAPLLDTQSDSGVESMEEIQARQDLMQRTAMSLGCIVLIFEQAGHGKMMARHLIEEEIKTAKPEVVASLKRLLDWPQLKIEEKK